MSEATFAFEENSSKDYESSIDPSDPLLRKGIVERMGTVLKHVKHVREVTTSSRFSTMTTSDVSTVSTVASEGNLATTDSDPSEMTTKVNYDVSEIIDFPDMDQGSQTWPRVTFHALQEWEGYVIEIGEDDFTVRLLDLTAGSSHEEEEAVILLSEISEDDLKRLRLGSVFRWVIGYARSASGTKRRVSQVVFRELPVVTKQDIAEAEERARKTAQLWAK